MGFVEDFHGNSSSNHGSVEAVIKGNERGAGCACVSEQVGVHESGVEVSIFGEGMMQHNT